MNHEEEAKLRECGVLKEIDVKDADGRNDNDIKSKAVVKYSASVVPAPYTMLQLNTNLNLPPSNWLSNSVAAYGVPHHILNRSGFSSFAMANKFPDCIGVVDVISDAENVKKLLKMSNSSGPISLLVHRIENTLLIDEFDIAKVRLASGSRWHWFRQFFEKHIQSLELKPDKVIEYKNSSRTALQQKSLVSKFLYHSLVPSPDVQTPTNAQEEVRQADSNVAIPLPFTEPILPEPRIEEELPDPTFSHNFARNVVWNFEDIQMLLGTDIPIFGGGTHPCISLRLRDMSKPINVLTGMDYWLDNLMCNVPEVIMCYHLNGIVQKYELIKTEDLPHLPNSKFSTKVIRDIAQNILSFLKANATKSGHTYWLFRGRNDDVVKLYDLTSLCNDVLEGGKTPFTVPVAMLLYRVARNMKQQNARRQASTICKLLKNCISLLPSQKYSEIETSAHYMLADVYIPCDLVPSEPDFSDGSDDSNDSSTDMEEDVQLNEDDYLAISSLNLSSIQEPQDEPVDTSLPQAPSLSSDILTRCFDGLHHVVNGLRCISNVKSSEPKLAKPSESIPMAYQSLNRDNESGATREKGPSSVVLRKSPEAVPTEISWDVHLKVLLYDKASLIYMTLLEHYYSKEEFGIVLKYASTAMLIINVLNRLRSEHPPTVVESSVYSRTGDTLLILATRAAGSIDKHREAYSIDQDNDTYMRKLVKKEGGKDEDSIPLPPDFDSIESVLLTSVTCYSHAVSVAKDDERHSILRRLGNVENEVGVLYMNKAIGEMKRDIDRVKGKSYVKCSESHLDAGIAAFQKAEDSANLALLYNNYGKLMRLSAHIHASADERSTLVNQERIFYKKAISYYQQALEILGERSSNPSVWDPVYWELSTTYYTMASLLQDYPVPSKSDEDAEREVIDLLHKALKYCDLDTSGARLPIYEYRFAKIHHRLASLHHRQFRRSEEEARRKHTNQLSRLHYEKASRFFLSLEHSLEFLTVQMERVALDESLAEVAGRPTMKCKHFIRALGHIVECTPILQLIVSGNDSNDETDCQSEDEELIKILKLLLQRLQFILLSLIKNTTKKTDDKISSVCAVYKKLYTLSLKTVSSTCEIKCIASGLIKIIAEVKTEIQISEEGK